MFWDRYAFRPVLNTPFLLRESEFWNKILLDKDFRFRNKRWTDEEIVNVLASAVDPSLDTVLLRGLYIGIGPPRWNEQLQLRWRKRFPVSHS